LRIDDLRFIWDYYYWATWKVLDACEGLSDAEFAGPAVAGERNLRDILVHTMSAERGWRIGFITAERVEGLTPADFPSVASVATRWREEEAATRAYLAGLDDATLDEPPFEGKPLWQFLTHVANHGTQHRSEAALILTDLGRSPGDLDLVEFMFRDE